MTVEDVVVITTVHEGIRTHALQVDPDKIPNCIESCRSVYMPAPAIIFIIIVPVAEDDGGRKVEGRRSAH
jgi:hypothetical protein